MREALTEIANRLRKLPDKASELITQKAETGDEMRESAERMKAIENQTALEVASARNSDGKPLFSNELLRQNETMRRLSQNEEYTALDSRMKELRQKAAELDTLQEFLQKRFKADISILSAVSALFGAGKGEDAEALLNAYTVQPVEPSTKPETKTPPKEEKTGGGLETAVFEVLEAKKTESGATRAWCENVATGEKTAIFAKNGNAKSLAGAIGSRIEVKYRILDHGLFAVSVKSA